MNFGNFLTFNYQFQNEKHFELGDTVEVDFGSKLGSYKYRDYYDTKRIIRT